MKVLIAVRNIAREVVVDIDMSADDFTNTVKHAVANREVLELSDTQGQKYLIPAEAIGFTQIVAEESRRVGFAL